MLISGHGHTGIIGQGLARNAWIGLDWIITQQIEWERNKEKRAKGKAHQQVRK